VRVALFARLGDLDAASVLDLYAGTGSLGIEALSRGAAEVVFVERSARCAAVLRANLAALSLEPRARVVVGDVPRVVGRLAREGARFDLALLDPPYAAGEVGRALEALAGAALLAPGATVVVEGGRRHPVPRVEGFAPVDVRRYGDSVITRLQAGASAGRAGAAATARGGEGPA
jgi:16S rRNA (guanine966-N2)-methyltransferase